MPAFFTDRFKCTYKRKYEDTPEGVCDANDLADKKNCRHGLLLPLSNVATQVDYFKRMNRFLNSIIRIRYILY